jgi:hypothetical protein
MQGDGHTNMGLGSQGGSVMARPLDLEGSRFGRLLVVHREPSDGRGRLWRAICDCGEERVLETYSLTSGGTASCGCFARERSAQRATTHGRSRSQEHITWKAVKQRCYDENARNYKWYGGRGIEVCERWRDSFENFLADMGPKPSNDHSIDRKDSNGDYCPENCRWATLQEQRRNQSNNRLLEIHGIVGSLVEWSEVSGIPAEVIRGRLDRCEWTPYDAVTKPVRRWPSQTSAA